MTKVIVFHQYYGCDTGCCGHVVQVDDGPEEFHFAHPYGSDPKEFAKSLVSEHLGADHVADLDWDHCIIEDNC